MMLLLPACSDYDLATKADAVADADDTAFLCPDDPPEAPSATVDETCLRAPTVGTFTPVIEWQWNLTEVMSSPIVADLDGDTLPEILFASYAAQHDWASGTLNAIHGDGSGVLWSLPSAGGYTFAGLAGIAVGDLEGDGSPDVCAAGNTIGVICVEADGTFKWAAGTEMSYLGLGHPAIADLDGDGLAEVVYGRQAFASNGRVIGLGTWGTGSTGVGWGYEFFTSFPADMNGDGDLEIVAGNTVYEPDGTVVWHDGGPDGAPAVADFDLDGKPDVVRTTGGTVRLTGNDGVPVWTATIPCGGDGGPPTVADLDGDGAVEVGVASLACYTVFETDGSVKWSVATSDYSSSWTGSTVFDFEGDGDAEIVYADEFTLYVFDGATGVALMAESGHGSGTGLEYPVVADVDNDGATEIVLGSNTWLSDGWRGITVIGDADDSWAPARPIWNQYAYHITNIDVDGGIPSWQEPNWESWNNFRAAGSELGPGHWLADLAPGEPEVCCDEAGMHVYVPVVNRGMLTASGATLTVGTEAFAIPDVPAGGGVVVGPIDLVDGDYTITIRGVEECEEGDNSAILPRCSS